MSAKSSPKLGGGTAAPSLQFPLVAPTPGAAGQEEFAFATGGGLHGGSDGSTAFTSKFGDVLVADAQGGGTFQGALRAVGLATLAGGVSTNNLAAATLQTTGNANVGGALGVAGNTSIAGTLAAASFSSQGAISGASLAAQGAISGDSLNIAHAATLGSLSVAGTFTAQQIASDGPIYFPTSGPAAPGLGAEDDHSYGLYYGPGGTLGFAAAGATVLSFTAQGAGTLAGPLQAAAITATGLTSQILTITGASQLHALQATTLQLTGAATLASDLTVQGTARLANLAIDHITTDHDLTVGGNATVDGNTQLQGTLAVQGAAQLAAGLSVGQGGSFGGALVSGSLSTGGAVVAGLQAVLAGQNAPVLVQPVPGGVVKYSVTLDNQGNLALSGTLAAFGATTLSSGLTVGGALSGATAAFTGAVSSQGAVSGSQSTFGGSTFQTCQGSPNGQLTGSVGDTAIDRQSGLAYLKFSGSQTQSGWVEVTTQANATGFPLLAPTGPSTAAPPYSFADDGRSGLGRTSALPLYLAVAGNLGLSFDASGNATFAQGLAATGATQLAGLTAGATSLGALTAQATTVTTLQASSGQLSGALTVGGALGAGATTLASLLVTGQAHLMGAVACDAGVTSQAFLAAPQARVGGSALSAGSAAPSGAVVGSPGDGYFEQDNGTWWIKTSGQATKTGWSSVATSATATAFPLAAPLAANLSAPSYGFAGSMMGLTDQGANQLVAVAGGLVGWRLNAQANMEVTGTLQVDGTFTAQAGSVLAATQATSLQVSGSTSLAGLSVSGSAALAAFTSSTGTLTGALTAAQLASQGAVKANGSSWTAGASAPSSGGQAGDFATVQSGGAPLYVRTSSAWRAVQLVGDPTPSQFPLRGSPADSASAPNFAPSANYPGAGMFLAGANILGFATNGVSAGTVDANGNWSLVGTLAAGAATFPSLQVNGALGATGAATLGSTLQVTGAVTLAAALNAASVVSSGAVSGTNGSFSGTLAGQTLNVSGNATIGGTLTVNGATTYTGVQKAPYYQAGDGSLGSPAYAFTSEPALGWWRSASGTLTAQAGGANIASLTASAATFAAAVNVGGTNAGLLSPAANVLQLQAGGTVGFTLNTSSVAAALPLVVPAGSSSAPGLQVGGAAGLYAAYDARAAFPVSVSLVNPRGAGLSLTTIPDPNTNSSYYVLGAAGGGLVTGAYAPNGYATGAPGQLYQYTGGGSGSALYVYEGSQSGATGWVAVRTASQPVTPSYPAVGPAGSAAAPTFAVGSAGSGLYSGTDANSRAFVGLAQGGAAVARLATFQNSSTQVYVLGLGEPTSSSVSGGLVASAQAPTTGAPAAFPGMLYQDTRGGAAQSLWVNESTGTTPAFAKVLTTSSPAPQPAFPLAAPSDTAAAPSYAWAGSTGTGLYLAAANSLGFTTAGAKAATVSSAQAWTFFGAVSCATTLAATGAASFAGTLTVSGATTLQAALSGTAAAFSGNATVGGTLAVTGLTSGPTSSWTASVTSPLLALTETTAPATAATGQLFVKSSDHNLYFLSSAGTTSQITPLATSFPLAGPADSAAAPDYSWAGSTGTGLYLAGANILGFTTNGTKAATVSAAQAWAFAGAVSCATTLAANGATSLGSTLTVAGATTLQAALSGTSATLSGNASVGGTLGVTGLTTASGGVLAAAGTASAPGLAVGAAASGFWAGSDGYSTPAIGVTVAGLANSVFKTTSANSTPVYIFGLGVAASTTANGGIIASAQTPVGQIGAFPSQLYQWLGGGPSKSLWVYEGTSSGNSAWAQVLTTSSTVSPTYPLQSSTLGSATSPAYGFATSGYTTTGIFAAQDASSSQSVLAVTAAGIACAFFETQTVSSQTIYEVFFGPASGAAGGIRCGNLSPNGNLGATGGQAFLYTNGGAGTTLWVHESNTASSTWAYAFTSGMAQLAAANGAVGAPYYSFAAAKTTGIYHDGTYPYLVSAGVNCLSWSTSVAGVSGYNGLVFGTNNTAGIPYIIGVPSTAANAGNPTTNAINAYQAALLLNGAGAAGNQMWLKEVSGGTSGWVRVLSESTALSFSRLLQTTAPASVASQSLIYARTDNQIGVVTATNAGVAAVLRQDLAATNYGATQTITAAQSGITVVAANASQFTLTLPANSTTNDQRYRFQVETASGVVIKAATGQIIYYGGSASSSGGTLTSTTVGSTVELFQRAGTNNWYSYSAMGTWTAA